MNAVAQFDLGHGYTGAAEAARSAWARSEQAVAAADHRTGVVSTSPFIGFKWSEPVITWSFATSDGDPASPFSGSIQAQYQPVIEKAVQAWASAAGIQLDSSKYCGSDDAGTERSASQFLLVQDTDCIRFGIDPVNVSGIRRW